MGRATAGQSLDNSPYRLWLPCLVHENLATGDVGTHIMHEENNSRAMVVLASVLFSFYAVCSMPFVLKSVMFSCGSGNIAADCEGLRFGFGGVGGLVVASSLFIGLVGSALGAMCSLGNKTRWFMIGTPAIGVTALFILSAGYAAGSSFGLLSPW